MDMELLETDFGGMSQLVFIILFFVSVYLCQRNVVVNNELVKKKRTSRNLTYNFETIPSLTIIFRILAECTRIFLIILGSIM